MAGAGFKTFNTGDVLTASDVNTYLMQQTVMVFANAAARTTALGANVAEGMISYLKDTNAVEVYDGSNWVSSDDPNAIQNTIVDAKGDIITATANDTPARLAVGSNGYTLVADSSTSTGLAYASSALAQPVINGGMDIWQRGTSISLAASTTTTTYLADRFCTKTDTNQACTISRQATNDTTNLPFIQYCMRYQRNSGQTGTSALNMATSIETINSIPYAGRTVTLSFYARKGADYSASGNALNVFLIAGTGTDQNRITGGFTGEAYPIDNQTATLTTTWQRFSYTATIGSTITELAPYFRFTPTGTASTNDYYELTGIQIDLGSTALPFRRSGGTIQGELAACQRYYIRNTTGSAFGAVASGSAGSTTSSVQTFVFPSQMRVKPTSVDYANLELGDNNASAAVTSLSINTAICNATIGAVDAGATGLTQYRYYNLRASNNTAAYLGFNAEL